MKSENSLKELYPRSQICLHIFAYKYGQFTSLYPNVVKVSILRKTVSYVNKHKREDVTSNNYKPEYLRAFMYRMSTMANVPVLVEKSLLVLRTNNNSTVCMVKANVT